MNDAFTVFSPQQWQVLQALNTYRFLTVEQMLQLGISKNARSLRDKTLFALRYHKCIHSEKIGSFLPDVHHLTKRGRKLLAQIEGDTSGSIPSCKRMPFSPIFAPHRFAQVDFHIGLRNWVKERGDADISRELQDFVCEQNGGKKPPRPSTEMIVPTLAKSIIPDGAFVVELDTGEAAIYLVEIHRTTQSRAVAEQLVRYFEVIKTSSTKRKFGVKSNPVICSVHYQTPVLTSVKSRLKQHAEFAQFQYNFVFREMADLSSNFTEKWHFADDMSARPFPYSTQHESK